MINRPVIFGELLFDCFPDGSKVLGGAPFNVAWHLHGFGLQPLLISRVGDDKDGQQVLAALNDWTMDAQGIQIDRHARTGTVEVTLSNGQPSFDIVTDVAYDFIDADEALAALSGIEPALLYHGSLAVRNKQSGMALQALCRSGAPRFVDINLRPPWWQTTTVEQLLQGVRWVKLNDHELLELTGGMQTDRDALYQAARSMRKQFSLEVLVVTCGDQGAFIATDREELHGQPVVVDEVADTVGAGDAFSAVFILGVMRQWPLTVILPRALEFAAAICTVRGATVQDPGFYQKFKAAWHS